MIGEVRIVATFDMYVNAGRSNSPLHSVFIEKYFAAARVRPAEKQTQHEDQFTKNL